MILGKLFLCCVKSQRISIQEFVYLYLLIGGFMMKYNLSKLPTRYWSTILLALVTAFIFSRLSFVEGKALLNAVPWGIITLIVTIWLGISKVDALRIGAVFGFIVSYAYLWFDNRNIHSITQILTLIPLIILPSLFGLLCGTALGYLGWQLRRLFIKKTSKH